MAASSPSSPVPTTTSYVAVERLPFLQEHLQLGAGVECEDRTVAVETDARGGVREPDVEQHDVVLPQQLARLLGQHRSPAEAQHAVVLGQRPGHGLALQPAEVLLAVVDEDVGDPLPGVLRDVAVGVAEGHPEPGSHPPADRRLARAGRAHQDDQGAGHRIARPFR
jgi:hypothetical protein